MATNQKFLPDVEHLEERCVPAGNVLVDVNDAGDLIVTGDVRNNTIRLTQSGNDFFVEGIGTDINGLAVNITVTVTRDIRIDMAGGSDEVSIIGDGSSAIRDLRFNGGTGDDLLDVTGLALSRDFSATGRDDNDISITSSTIGRDALFDFRKANDNSLALGSVLVQGDVNYKGSLQTDTLRLHSSTDVLGDVVVRLGHSDSNANSLEISSSSIGGDVDVTGGRDGDDLTIASANISGSVLFRGRAGGDDVHIGSSTISGDVSLLLGQANGDTQEVRIDFAQIGGTLRVTAAGTGDESITLDGPTIAGDVRLDLRNGDNDVLLRCFTSIGGDLRITTGRGEDSIELNECDVTGTTTMTTGSGSDDVSIAVSTFHGDFFLNTSNGDDNVDIARQFGASADVIFNGQVDGKLGRQNDVLRMGIPGTSAAIFNGVSKFDGGPDFDEKFDFSVVVNGTLDLVNFEN
jgi:hypothetical protein